MATAPVVDSGIEDIITYTVTVRKDKRAKDLYYYEVKAEDLVRSGQALGIGQAMNLAADIAYTKLQDEGRVR